MLNLTQDYSDASHWNEQKFHLASTLVQTTDDTPTVLAELDWPGEVGGWVEVEFFRNEVDLQEIQRLFIRVMFKKKAGHDLEIVPANDPVQADAHGDFPDTAPKLELVPDTVNDVIQLVATGEVGKSINWWGTVRMVAST